MQCAFQAHGGKIIMTHGLADEIVSTGSSTDYYSQLTERFGPSKVDSFVRFYLMPGVGHGTGPFHPAIDSLSALDAWVQSGSAPETLTERPEHGDARTLAATLPLPTVAALYGRRREQRCELHLYAVLTPHVIKLRCKDT